MSETNGIYEVEAEPMQDSAELNEVEQYKLTLWQLQESIQRLEQSLYDPNWRMLTMSAENEFSPAGLKRIAELARIMRLKNPLIMRGSEVQRLYVWAQGVSMRSADDNVQAAIHAFITDAGNAAAVTGHQARGRLETKLQTDATLYFRFFTNTATGAVKVRTVDMLEIVDVVYNPEDSAEPWLYKRQWAEQGLDGTTKPKTAYYPDWQFAPVNRAAVASKIDGVIEWGTPVYMVQVNGGVCEFYSSLDWALAFKTFLEQLASVWQALARWSAKLTTKGGARGVAAAKSKLQSSTTSPPLTGSTFVGGDGVDLQPFRTAGATMSADDGRRLMLMAIMPFGFPETFYGDTSVGTLATAKSLDRPTELKIRDRQALWRDVFLKLLTFAVTQAAKAGKVAGVTVTRTTEHGQHSDVLTLPEGAEIKVEFPPIIEQDIPALVTAITDAATWNGHATATDAIPTRTAVEQLLRVLNVPDVAAVLVEWDALQDSAESAEPGTDDHEGHEEDTKE